MNPTTLPLNEIIVKDRQRKDMGDITSLADSLRIHGLIQPIVLNQDRQLIAGGRRFAAANSLGWSTIAVVFRETLSADELHELELEENIRRKEMSWTEKCQNIATIFKLKRKRSALEAKSFTYKDAGEMLSVSDAYVHYCVQLAKEIDLDPQGPIATAPTMADAWKLVMKRSEDMVLDRLAKSVIKSVNGTQEALPPEPITIESIAIASDKSDIAQILQQDDYTGILTLKKEAVETYFKSLPNTTIPFDQWYATSVSRAQRKLDARYTLDLSHRFFNCDCIQFMEANESRFDHIITDIPYGIDMSMLSQQNQGMADIASVDAEHDVKGNEELMTQFFPKAFNAIKESGFLITWCDISQWQFMYDLGTAAGFKIQRWPIVWIKTHPCMNNAAQYNFTKTFEVAMVCRKGNAIMIEKNTPSHVVAGHDDFKETLGHPFVKPFAIWEHLIKAVSIEGQLIYEPFMGSGSGVISMLRMKRNVIGTELNKEHFNRGLENIKQEYLTINPNFKFI